jgi:hypothetical protein
MKEFKNPEKHTVGIAIARKLHEMAKRKAKHDKFRSFSHLVQSLVTKYLSGK